MSAFKITVTAWKADWFVTGTYHPHQGGYYQGAVQIDPDIPAHVETDSICLPQDAANTDLTEYLQESVIEEIERQCVNELQRDTREFER